MERLVHMYLAFCQTRIIHRLQKCLSCGLFGIVVLFDLLVRLSVMDIPRVVAVLSIMLPDV